LAVAAPERAPVSPDEALHRAVLALAQGHFDDRSLEGAKANALESIAWSLAGLLAEKVEAGAHHRPAPRPHPEGPARSLVHEVGR
jgi:hypothetical protein